MRPCWIVYREGLYTRDYLERIISYKKNLFHVTIIREKAFPYTVFKDAVRASLFYHGMIEPANLDYDYSNMKRYTKILP